MTQPRIRSIKPEIWQSPDWRSLSSIGKVTFLALWSNADDEGRMRTNAAHLASVFVNEPADVVQQQLDHMERLDMVRCYRADHVDYAFVVNFTKHQRIDKPKVSTLPKQPKVTGSRLQRMRAHQRPIQLDFVAESSKTRRGRVGHRSDQIRSDQIRSDQPLSTFVDPVGLVFVTWRETTGKTARTVLDEKRKRVISAALRAYPLDDVLDAVKGWQVIPHNRGENDRRRPFNDIELLLRDAKHIELFRDAQRGQIATAGKVHHLDSWAANVLNGGDRLGS